MRDYATDATSSWKILLKRGTIVIENERFVREEELNESVLTNIVKFQENRIPRKRGISFFQKIWPVQIPTDSKPFYQIS